MKQVRRRADLRGALAGEFRALLQQFAAIARGGGRLNQSRETQLQGRERLARGVVEVAANATAFVVLEAHQLAGGSAEIGERLLSLEADAAAGGAVVAQQG